MKKYWVAILLVAFAGACAKSSTTAASTEPNASVAPTTSPAASAAAMGGTVHVATDAKLGRILVDKSGLTLYHFDKDKPGAIACTAACTGTWPPLRTSLLEADMPGTRLTLEGIVADTSCTPIANARVDFWQADSKGVYDNQGYRLRGYQSTNTQGIYHLETVVPGEYPGRTPHIHVKVTPPGGTTLTTQLYMPGVASNNRDSIFNPATVMKVKDLSGGKAAIFDFVVSR